MWAPIHLGRWTFMQGVEVVNYLLLGSEEVTLHRPDVVDGTRPAAVGR